MTMPVTFSQFARGLTAETAFDVLAVAQRLKAAGKDVIELQIGDSPFPTHRARHRPPASQAIEDGADALLPLARACPRSARPSPRTTRREFGVADHGRRTSSSAPGPRSFEQFFCEAFLDPGDAVLVFTPALPDLRAEHRTPRRPRRSTVPLRQENAVPART